MRHGDQGSSLNIPLYPCLRSSSSKKSNRSTSCKHTTSGDVDDSLVAMTMPASDFDTVAWRAWMHEYIAFSHRSDGVLGTNASLVVDALRELGHYSETLNEAFTFPAFPVPAWGGRRYAVQDITVKGIWFTRDVTTDVRVLSRLLQTTVRSVPHAFSAAMQVQQLAQVDVAAVHRVALPFSNQTAVEVRMQRGAVATLEALCLAGLVLAAALRRCRAGPT